MDATGVGNELREVLQAADNILAVPPDAIVSAIEAKNMRLGPPLALDFGKALFHDKVFAPPRDRF
jgi:hypothetical protein